MDTEHFKKQLIEKERELVSILARFEDEARVAGDIDVRDTGDNAVDDEDTWVTVEEAEVVSQTLKEVRDALKRIEEGSYGECIACGRQIESARLEAVPWTPYCRNDQEKEDARKSTPAGSAL